MVPINKYSTTTAADSQLDRESATNLEVEMGLMVITENFTY